jgi:threonine aldolase
MAKERAPVPAPGPVSRDREMEALAETCSRFLLGHGPRRASKLLTTVPEDTEIDYYGLGGVVEEIEREVASVLGKEASLFLLSGTMAQQAMLRVHADRRSSRTVAFHPSCHLDGWAEERGYQHLHGLFGAPVGSREAPLTAADLERVHQPVAALLVELPQRSLGGTVPDWDELRAQVEWARARGAAAHLDGARLWEASAYYGKLAGKSIADVAGLFDTVYVSFYKGLGGLAGCCVAGSRGDIDELAVWRTRHGGRAFMMWPYAASALSVLRSRLPLMPEYYRHALAIARQLRKVPAVEVLPATPQSPMMHLRLQVTVDELRSRVVEVAKSSGIWTFPRPFATEGPRLQRCELSVGDATLELGTEEIGAVISRLAGAGG